MEAGAGGKGGRREGEEGIRILEQNIYFISYLSFCQRSLCHESYIYNLMMNCTLLLNLQWGSVKSHCRFNILLFTTNEID